MKRADTDAAAQRSAVAMRGMFWWIDRWRHSSAYMEMTVEQQGAYRNLLDEMWLRGGAIPNNPKLLAKASGDPQRWRYLRPTVMKWFHLDGKKWRNDTLSQVRHQSQRRADKQRAYRQRMKTRYRKNGNDPGNGAGNDPG